MVIKIRILLLILAIGIPCRLVYAQPGCGNTHININEWRPAGQMVKVKIRLQYNGKKTNSFKVSAKDSVVVFEHRTGSMYCKLRVGRKVVKIWMDSLNCNLNYHFSLCDSTAQKIKLTPAAPEDKKGHKYYKSIQLVARKENTYSKP